METSQPQKCTRQTAPPSPDSTYQFQQIDMHAGMGHARMPHAAWHAKNKNSNPSPACLALPVGTTTKNGNSRPLSVSYLFSRRRKDYLNDRRPSSCRQLQCGGVLRNNWASLSTLRVLSLTLSLGLLQTRLSLKNKLTPVMVPSAPGARLSDWLLDFLVIISFVNKLG